MMLWNCTLSDRTKTERLLYKKWETYPFGMSCTILFLISGTQMRQAFSGTTFIFDQWCQGNYANFHCDASWNPGLIPKTLSTTKLCLPEYGYQLKYHFTCKICDWNPAHFCLADNCKSSFFLFKQLYENGPKCERKSFQVVMTEWRWYRTYEIDLNWSAIIVNLFIQFKRTTIFFQS